MVNTNIYTKKEIVENLALHCDVVENTNAAASRIVEHLIADVTQHVADGYDVNISGFINLKPAVQAAKSGTVPGSNPPKQYTSPEKKVVKVKPAKAFSDAVAGA